MHDVKKSMKMITGMNFTIYSMIQSNDWGQGWFLKYNKEFSKIK